MAKQLLAVLVALVLSGLSVFVYAEKTSPVLGQYGKDQVALVRFQKTCIITIAGTDVDSKPKGYAVWLPAVPDSMIILPAATNTKDVIANMNFFFKKGYTPVLKPTDTNLVLNNKEYRLFTDTNTDGTDKLQMMIIGTATDQTAVLAMDGSFSTKSTDGKGVMYKLDGFKEALDAAKVSCTNK